VRRLQSSTGHVVRLVAAAPRGSAAACNGRARGADYRPVEVDFSNLLVVAAVAFAAPLLLGLAPGLRLPAVVLEIVAGIVIGPSLLGWVDVDEPVSILSTVGLAFLLFLAGLEIDLERLRGPKLRAAGLGFVVSFALAVVVSLGLAAAGQVDTPLLVAVILVATSLGVVVAWAVAPWPRNGSTRRCWPSGPRSRSPSSRHDRAVPAFSEALGTALRALPDETMLMAADHAAHAMIGEPIAQAA
jgi:hypothetical protein